MNAVSLGQPNSGTIFTDNRFVAFESGDTIRFDEHGGMEIRDEGNVILYQHRGLYSDLSVDNIESRMLEDNFLYLSNPSKPGAESITLSRSPSVNGGAEGNDGYYQRTFKLWHEHEY